jgi:hypothetical protein
VDADAPRRPAVLRRHPLIWGTLSSRRSRLPSRSRSASCGRSTCPSTRPTRVRKVVKPILELWPACRPSSSATSP